MGDFEDFVASARLQSERLYPARFGTVIIKLDQKNGVALPSSATVLLTEHRQFGIEQYVLNLPQGQRVARRLPIGAYTVTVSAKEYDPYRTYIQVAEGEVIPVVAHLEVRKQQPPSFATRLLKYGLQLDDITVRDLSLQEGEKLALDPQSPPDKSDVHFIELRTVNDVKRVLGHADKYYPGDYPRFGVRVPFKPDGEELQRVTADFRAALREYVYGNSKSVSQWEASLNTWIGLEHLGAYVFVYGVVDVGPFATLEIGPAGLSCDVLRVEITGTVQVVSNQPVNIEIGTYEVYNAFPEQL